MNRYAVTAKRDDGTAYAATVHADGPADAGTMVGDRIRSNDLGDTVTVTVGGHRVVEPGDQAGIVAMTVSLLPPDGNANG
jgi:hypothetical protein